MSEWTVCPFSGCEFQRTKEIIVGNSLWINHIWFCQQIWHHVKDFEWGLVEGSFPSKSHSSSPASIGSTIAVGTRLKPDSEEGDIIGSFLLMLL
jgi:hypothetical protein